MTPDVHSPKHKIHVESEWGHGGYFGKFSPDSRWLLCRRPFENFLALDLQNWSETFAPAIDADSSGSESLIEPVFTPDSSLVAGIARDGNAYVWRIQKKSTEKIEPAISNTRSGFISGQSMVVFSPKGTFVLASNNDGSVFIWPSNRPHPAPLPRAVHGTSNVRFEVDATEAYVFSYDGTDLFLGRLGERLELILRHNSLIKHIAVTGNRRELIVFGSDITTILTQKFLLWGLPIKTLPWPELALNTE